LRQLSFIQLFSLLLLAGACQEPAAKKPAPAQGVYFDVPGFIQSQAAILDKEDPEVLKSVVENSQVRERKTLAHLKWQKELAAFSDLDLNKPAFRNSFFITRQADSAGLVTETYRKKPGTAGDIAFLAITRGANQQVHALRATVKNENPLITTSQHLALSCASKNGRFRIQTFQIGGRQKPLFFDPLHYLIITEIH
jgi:hypothetical protein